MTIAENLNFDTLYYSLFNAEKKIHVEIYLDDDMKYPGKLYHYTLEIVGNQWAILKPIG